ncbi:MAG: hypothetical protein RLZZ324_719 [Candidatus Parcubacteria bacterium]|jgi:heat-inducible transcriptional repressor
MPESAEDRLKEVFRIVVREYLRSAEPVGSAHLVTRYRLGVSPATVRNDMVELEERGLLVQPHTSAGRIPTEAGYRYYVDQFVHRESLEERRRKELEQAVHDLENDMEAAGRAFAKKVAEITGETAIVRFGTQAYLTGVSNMLQKPEFSEGELMREAMRVIDDLDALTLDARSRVNDDVTVLIGRENPFGHGLSSVITVFAAPGVGEAVIGVLGPQRMDYDANVSLMRYLRERLEELE